MGREDNIAVTWIQNPSNGEISFFKLSLIIPYIFSRKAVSCCLKSKAGYLASTCRSSSRPPRIRLLRNENPALCGDARSPYKLELLKKIKSNYMIVPKIKCLLSYLRHPPK